jgi:hypothetical protein
MAAAGKGQPVTPGDWNENPALSIKRFLEEL